MANLRQRCRLALDPGSHPASVCRLYILGTCTGLLHALGYDSNLGHLFWIVSARADVRLPLWEEGRSRRMVGIGSLHRDSQLAAFLARRRVGEPEIDPLELCRPGSGICGGLLGRV